MNSCTITRALRLLLKASTTAMAAFLLSASTTPSPWVPSSSLMMQGVPTRSMTEATSLSSW